MNPLIAGMRGAEIGATDFERVCRFYEAVWTLRPLAKRDGIATFAGTAADHPILTVVAGATSARRIVWSARTEAALAELHGRTRRRACRSRPPIAPSTTGSESASTAAIPKVGP